MALTGISLNSFLSVGVGAAMGAWLRWILGGLLNPLFPILPIGTLAANLIGGLLVGLFMGCLAHFESVPADVRLFITTGFLGGLTTFSTFSAETITLLLRQQYAWACALIGLHVIGSLTMTLAGVGLVRWLLRV